MHSPNTQIKGLTSDSNKHLSASEIIDARDGYFGDFGGCYVPEVLRCEMDSLAELFFTYKNDPAFQREFKAACQMFSGRPTPLTRLNNLSDRLSGASIYLKREDLNQTGAHKINHCIGQILLAKRLGKQRIIAETGAGQHGYATASVCAKFGMKCTIYMGRKDYDRQRPNVFWMTTLGAEVVPVDDGEQTLNDAVIAAFKDLISTAESSHYLLGSAVGPHPYPVLNTWFQKIVGEEAKRQMIAQTERLPDLVTACVGGGSNALGIFFDFIDEPGVELVGVEAGGRSNAVGEHAAKVTRGRRGIFEGYDSYFLQDEDANISGTHSISAGLDYCGVSPILAHLHQRGRVLFDSATDRETLDALQLLARTEGIIIALESAHAIAYAVKRAPMMRRDQSILINGSGRGEKDLFITMKALQPEAMREYLSNQLSNLA